MSRQRAGLVLLALAAFLSVTSELLPVGALTAIAGDTGSTETQVGLLVTGYAVLAAVTAIPLTAVSAQANRRGVIAVALAFVGVGNLLAAMSPGYPTLLASRLVIAAAHGVFWSSIGSVAARLVPPGRAGAATGVVFAGNALALILGVPMTNALAAGVGWRAASAAIGVCAAVLAVGSRAILPDLPPVRGETGGRRRGSVRGSLAISVITLLVVTAYFATYTYVTPILAGTGIPPSSQPLILFAFGGTGLVGIALASRFVDVHPRATSMTQTATMVLALAGLLLAPADAVNTVAMLLVLSLGYAGLAVSWQTMVLSAAPRAPDSASSMYVVAFQVGIATGPVLGGTLRDLLSPPAAIAASVALAVAGAILTANLGTGRASTRSGWSRKPAAE